jgi:hypothetical protein
MEEWYRKRRYWDWGLQGIGMNKENCERMLGPLRVIFKATTAAF